MKLENNKMSIVFDVPERVSAEDVADFVRDALETCGGQRHPDDPLFQSLSVKKIALGGEVFEYSNPKEF